MSSGHVPRVGAQPVATTYHRVLTHYSGNMRFTAIPLLLVLCACGGAPSVVPDAKAVPISELSGSIPGAVGPYGSLTYSVTYPGGALVELGDPVVPFSVGVDGAISSDLPVPSKGSSISSKVRDACGFEDHERVMYFVTHENPSASPLPASEVTGVYVKSSGVATQGLWYSPANEVHDCYVQPGVDFGTEEYQLHLRAGWNVFTIYAIDGVGYFRTGGPDDLPWVKVD